MSVNEKNQVPNLTYPILIQTGDKNILIDAGIGNHKLTDKQLKIMVSRMKVKYMMN